MTALESMPKAAIFASSRSYGSKSKAVEKCIIITSILALSSRESAMSWQTVIIRLLHEYPNLIPCWPSYNHSLGNNK